jgi:hypothetical protein
MKYNRFEELPVWKAAIELAVAVFALTAKPTFKTYASLRNQLSGLRFQSLTTSRRAVSVVLRQNC